MIFCEKITIFTEQAPKSRCKRPSNEVTRQKKCDYAIINQYNVIVRSAATKQSSNKPWIIRCCAPHNDETQVLPFFTLNGVLHFNNMLERRTPHGIADIGLAASGRHIQRVVLFQTPRIILIPITQIWRLSSHAGDIHKISAIRKSTVANRRDTRRNQQTANVAHGKGIAADACHTRRNVNLVHAREVKKKQNHPPRSLPLRYAPL